MTNEELDKQAHPWPEDGKLVNLRWRKAVWMRATPWYKTHLIAAFTGMDVTYFQSFRFWFPFFTYNFKWIHGYIGWKPIPVGRDPAFGWSDLNAAQDAIANGELFVQLSMRGGVGDTS